MTDSPPNFASTPLDFSSPCTGVCLMDTVTGLCMGCLRTLKEIGGWRGMSPDEKRAVIAACDERAKTTPARDRDGTLLPPRA